MKRTELVKTRDALKGFAQVEGSAKWHYAINKNLKKADAVVGNYLTNARLSEEFEKARVKLCERHSRKDEKGKILMVEKIDEQDNKPRTSYDIVDLEMFGADLNALRDSTDVRARDLQTYMMEEEAEKIEWHKLKLDQFPEKVKELGPIMDLIEEEA